MAQPVFYQTLSMVGIDPTQYYNFTASVTPETPAPPFLPGTQAFGSDGSQFVFVQASTSISVSDFVVIQTGFPTGNNYQANSITSTNVIGSVALYGIGSTGIMVKGSAATVIPAGAFFWACTRGQYVPASTSGNASPLQATAGGVALFTSSTAGIVTSVTAAASLSVCLQGIICVCSITGGVPSSVVPPVGVLSSTGLTVGPVVHLNNPRSIILNITAFAAGTSTPLWAW